MKIYFNNKIDPDKWRTLLNKSKYSSPFQTPEFYEFFNSLNGYWADAFAVEENGEFKALLLVTVYKEKGIKSIFSKRGIIYGGPLIINDVPSKYFSFLLENVSKYYGRKLIYIEIRNGFNYEALFQNFIDAGWVFEEHLNVLLNVKGKSLNDILSNMKYNRRREINISYKEGANVLPAKDISDIKKLYLILKELYVKRVRLPLPELSFFESIFKYSDIGKVFIVRHNDNLIGGAFCIYSEKSINTLYYAGIRNYHKKIFPTHLAIMGVIDFAIKNNIPVVDFMGAGKPNEKYGVRDFKLQFGGKLVEHGRFLLILNPLLYKVGKKGIEFLTKSK